ncbi:UNVERIFIED_CONTAM: protein ANTHESIS POMOTING FACTOR 1 [Sesamum angustifolium]|uniref:Protein ANTHESIS POMOTING FACTOR 1 n=1 Tax=Sesamum angustifolium TaxID=2727405 RepID=A0AAW2NKM1_9LAMI
MIKNPFCLPGRLRPARKPTRRLSPMSLLDRLRDAVFRLIMLSALSKGPADARRSSSAQSSDHYYYSTTDHSPQRSRCRLHRVHQEVDEPPAAPRPAKRRHQGSHCWFFSLMMRGQPEREDKVSLELTEEILQSMEVGMAFRDYNGRISSMDFHKTSSYLVTASDDESIRLYDVASATVVSLSLCSRKDCFISGSLDRTVLLWDQRAEKCQGLLRVQGRPAAAYDDQGLVFAIAFGGYIRMFDARKYEKGPFDIFSLGGDMSEANVVKFSNDGRLMLLTTSNGHIHVLDSFRGTLLSTYNVKPVSSNSTLEASFSPEGMFVISGSGDGSVYAWSVRSGKEVASWMSTEAEPPIIKWAPGSLMFVTGSSELSFWIPDLSKLAAYVGRK